LIGLPPAVVDAAGVPVALELELLVLLLLLPHAATVRATASTPSAAIDGSLRLRVLLLMTLSFFGPRRFEAR
jgi:hypothetical protein